MSKYVIKKEYNTGGEIRFCGYAVKWDGTFDYMSGSMALTLEECETKIRELISNYKTIGIVKELEI